jgi:hypothetical protein
MRYVCLLLVTCVVACNKGSEAPPSATNATEPPRDAQHQGIAGPHGDHTPRHGGMVLMNGDVHYEVVLAPTGRHQVWFSDAMRNDLPASVASGVTMEVVRPGESAELVTLAIDDAGEAWVANARPLAGPGITVKLRYALQGTPQEIELPFQAVAP